MLRIHGDVKRLDYAPLVRDEVHNMAFDVMSDMHRRIFQEKLDIDAPSSRNIALPCQRLHAAEGRRRGVPRCDQDRDWTSSGYRRSSGGLQRSGPGALPADRLGQIDHTRRHGLPSTNWECHILTVEDPIEFVHTPKKSLINQREVGPHTQSFAAALRSALREDPDVILVGEMRDLETISLALTAAETGHLVFGTLHTSSAPKTVDRIIDAFPAGQQNQVRAMFSESLEAIVTQTLCKKKGGGRMAACEILVGVPAVRNLSRAKIHQILVHADRQRLGSRRSTWRWISS
jgi:twitching motility protein PilT